MSIAQLEIDRIDRLTRAITAMTEDQIKREVARTGHSVFRDETLGLGSEGSYSQFFSPFDWVNTRADVVLVGITPGIQQATEALLTLRSRLRHGDSVEDAAEAAKQSASFRGQMRTNGARLMDHFQIHRLLDLDSTSDLFGAASTRAHYTSILRYPVLKDHENYSGDARLMQRNWMRLKALETVPAEIRQLADPWIIPFGPVAADAVGEMARLGLIPGEKILAGILHPGAQQRNRHKVQLEEVTDEAALRTNGGAIVMERSRLLKQVVAEHLAAAEHKRSARTI